MKVKIKVILADSDGSFMGIGLAELIKGIEKHASIRKAAEDMNLSYPKAIRILKRLEDALSFPVIERKRGGVGGGGAQVTPSGLKFIEQYELYRKKITEFAENSFDEFFSDTDFKQPVTKQ